MEGHEAVYLAQRVNNSVSKAWSCIVARARMIPGRLEWEVIIWNTRTGYVFHCQDYTLFGECVRSSVNGGSK